MCEVMEQLRDESIERGMQIGIEQTKAEDIKFLMRKLGYTIQQAMDFLEIPTAEQNKYLADL